MKSEFKAYLEKIDLSSEAIEKNVGLIIDYAKRLCKEEIIDIFVNDYYQEDGSRGYGSLYLMSEKYICEARNFRNTVEYDIDVALLKDAVVYFRVYVKSYDFRHSTKESRFTIDCASETGTTFQLKACHENCDRLVEILDNYIRPNTY